MAAAGFNFLILFVGLAIIVGLIFLALDYIAKDEFLKRIGKLAIGGAALLVLLIDLKSVFFGGGGAVGITPVAILEFGIGVIVLLIIVYLINLAIDWWGPSFAPVLNYVLFAIALIVIMAIAEKALFGGGLGLVQSTSFRH